MSRPSLYTDEIGKDICARLAEGEILRTICEKHGIDRRTICNWKRDRSQFDVWYSQARMDRADTLFDDILEVGEDASTGGKTKEEILGLRVKMDGLKFTIARINPAKYGDKIIHAGDPDAPLIMRFEDRLREARNQLVSSKA